MPMLEAHVRVGFELAVSDKPNPLYYVRSARLTSLPLVFLLLEGMAIEQDSGLPCSKEPPFSGDSGGPALCSSRAREIATTAQRMIARNKFPSFHTAKENSQCHCF